MVTKLIVKLLSYCLSLILAKNHMVTKQSKFKHRIEACLILAKNHMVTKLTL